MRVKCNIWQRKDCLGTGGTSRRAHLRSAGRSHLQTPALHRDWVVIDEVQRAPALLDATLATRA